MAAHETPYADVSQRVLDAKSTLLGAGRYIVELFGKGIDEIGTEYKAVDGNTARTLIDNNSQRHILTSVGGLPSFYGTFVVAEEEMAETFPNLRHDPSLGGYVVGDGSSQNVATYWDPFDGTANAAIKMPMSTAGMCIAEDGRLVASVILDPFPKLGDDSGRVYWAEQGKGAWRAGLSYDVTKGGFSETGEPERITTDTKASSAKERYASTDSLFNQNTTQRKLGWIRDMVDAGLIMWQRSTGSNIGSAMQLAEGNMHYWLMDAVGGYFDSAGYALVEEAGGRVVNIHGEQPMPGDQVIVGVGNPADLEQVLGITQKHYQGYEGFR